MKYEMSREKWEEMHNHHKTCVLSMVMGYKHNRISSIELMDLIESYCEYSYNLGRNFENE